jgi:drug/metabolite transporter (DMT)-like permease
MEMNGIMFRVLIVTAIATLSGAAGQILMRKGMQIVGPLESYAPLDLLSYFWRALCQPYIIGGTIASGILYFALLAALSWTGVSVVFPLTALEYGFAAVLSIFILKEPVPPIRWAGIALVIIGVVLIGLSGSGETASETKREDSAYSAIKANSKGVSDIETR